ncbi:MAG: thioredoxin domain protein [Planctomycetota bacterium]|nr:thioredoxin domain protein [Planctomycetota bacterium]
MTNTTRFLALAAILMVPAATFGQTGAATKAKASIYDAKADARELVKAATTIAGRDSQRVLVMFGGDWCGWCHKLHTLFKTDKDIRKILSEDYQLVMVDTKARNAEALLAECQGDLKSVGYPFLAVLDADGKILTRQKTDPLEEGEHHDPKKVKAFLEEWAPPKVSAAKVVEAALVRASSEDKRIFLHFGAPWCGWCHKLDGFLAREDVAKILGKDFVDVKIDVDRMIGGKDVEAQYRKNVQGGIPWFAFLDAKGEEIANANGPKGNIGYPATAEEIAHFVSMLKKAARKMDAGDIEAIEKALKAEGEKLEAVQRERAAASAARIRTKQE